MRASYRSERRPIERLYDIAFRADLAPPALLLPGVAPAPILVDAQADIDISDSAFDFVRSIRVYEITYRQSRSSDGSCDIWWNINVGSYGIQGDYGRRRSDPSSIPEASNVYDPPYCTNY
jgi:hypothetical protein